MKSNLTQLYLHVCSAATHQILKARIKSGTFIVQEYITENNHTSLPKKFFPLPKQYHSTNMLVGVSNKLPSI